MTRLFPPFPRVDQAAWQSFSIVLGLEVLLLSMVVLIAGYEGSFVLLHVDGGSLPDALMPHLTHLADGALVAGCLGLLFAHRNPWLVVGLIFSLILVALVVPLLKHGVFPDWHRPAASLDPGLVRELSLGKERFNSFPSGHSTAAACLGWFVAGFGNSRRWGIVSALVTLVLAYTRVYLGVHFPGDLAAGLALGILLALAGTWLACWLASVPAFRAGPPVWLLRLTGAVVFVLAIVQTWNQYYQ